MRIVLALSLLILLFSWSIKSNDKKEVVEFIGFFEGHFSNENQAFLDSNFLSVSFINKRFWNDVEHTIWFYSEQYVEANPSQAFFQKIISIEYQEDGFFHVEYYLLENFQLYSTHAKFKKDLNELNRDELIPQKGCQFKISKKTNSWKLLSSHKECISSLNKADYTLVDMIISENEILDWSRGIDQYGLQVWGPSTPYVFQRKSH